MKDFTEYQAACATFSEEFVAYGRARLERAGTLERTAKEDTVRVQALTQAQAKAAEAAARIRPRRVEPPVISTSVNLQGIEEAIGKVQASFASYGGYFERQDRKAIGRQAAAYLRAMDPILEQEITRLESEAPVKRQAALDAQSAEGAAIRATFESHADAVGTFVREVGAGALPFDDDAWNQEDWGTPTAPNVVRISDSYNWIGEEKCSIPFLARIPGENVFVYASYFPERRKDLVNGVLLRCLRSASPGKQKLLLIDPTSLGEIFSPILSLSEHSEEALHTKVWTGESDIRARLEEASDRVGLIIQRYLTDEYRTLDEYNAAAGEVTEPNIVIAINDFPRGLDTRSIEIIKSLADVGPRCGVSLVVLQGAKLDNEQLKACSELSELSQISLGNYELDLYFRDSSNGYQRSPTTVSELTAKVPAWLDMYTFEGSIGRRASAINYVAGGKGRLRHGEPATPWSPVVAESVLERVGRRFQEGARVEVRLERVWELFDESFKRTNAEPITPNDPATWWQLNSTERLTVPIGRQGSRGVATMSFDSQLCSSALLVGRPGSGKSNLLHVIICTLAALYPPEELELYLLDFKEAVEFAGYAEGGLPHAKAIALESDREFGLAVLKHLAGELERRGKLFRASTGEQSNLITFRTQGGEKLPRIVLLIDEFHRLFDREDTIAAEAAKYLDDLVRLGRGFGIHCLLASQTLLGMNALGRHTLNQVAIRVALQCSEEDSRVVFSDENAAGALLSRPGEAIKNSSGGRVANNEPFQVPLFSEEERGALVAGLRARANKDGVVAQARIYRRDVQARWEPPALAGEEDLPAVRLGDAVALDPRFSYPLIRESGRNILMVGRSELLASGMLAAVVADLQIGHGSRVEIVLVDLMAVDGAVDRVAQGLGVRVRRRRDFEDSVRELSQIVGRREPSRTFVEIPHVLIVNGLGKVRELDVDDYSEPAQELASDLQTVLRDGPEVGVHTIAWCDSVASLDRRLGRRLEREFGARVAFTMSAEDSLRLCDTDAAAHLHDREALMTDIDRGVTTKFQPFEVPEIGRMAEVS
jgi:DNA segregation ATPase FtsK/SpoIIIE, S-DNA-T family